MCFKIVCVLVRLAPTMIILFIFHTVPANVVCGTVCGDSSVKGISVDVAIVLFVQIVCWECSRFVSGIVANSCLNLFGGVFFIVDPVHCADGSTISCTKAICCDRMNVASDLFNLLNSDNNGITVVLLSVKGILNSSSCASFNK